MCFLACPHRSSCPQICAVVVLCLPLASLHFSLSGCCFWPLCCAWDTQTLMRRWAFSLLNYLCPQYLGRTGSTWPTVPLTPPSPCPTVLRHPSSSRCPHSLPPAPCWWEQGQLGAVAIPSVPRQSAYNPQPKGIKALRGTPGRIWWWYSVAEPITRP